MREISLSMRSIARNLLTAISATTLTALILGTQANAAELNDSQILGIYIQVNSFDIETALLGRTLGKADGVRKLAEHVASDHAGVRQAAIALAEKCKVPIVLPSDRVTAAIDHDKTLQELLSLTGAAFDKSYLQHETLFHRAAIDAVRTVLLPSAKCAELQAHLREVLPAFEHHLAQTQTVARELPVR